MFISNNRALFHLWRQENSVKHQEVSKYENDCSYTKCCSFFRTIKQNKSLLVNKNCSCLILLAQKKMQLSNVFHSTSIFRRLYFYFVLKYFTIYFQCYAFHGAPLQHTSQNVKQGQLQNSNVLMCLMIYFFCYHKKQYYSKFILKA